MLKQTYEKQCTLCGTWFETTNSRRRYCPSGKAGVESECARTAHLIAKRELQKKTYAAKIAKQREAREREIKEDVNRAMNPAPKLSDYIPTEEEKLLTGSGLLCRIPRMEFKDYKDY